MELKGTFTYLIEIISDYIQDEFLLTQLSKLKSLLSNKKIREIEIKKFILTIGLRSSKTNAIMNIDRTKQIMFHCKSNSFSELQTSTQLRRQQGILQPISLNTVFNPSEPSNRPLTARPNNFNVYHNLLLVGSQTCKYQQQCEVVKTNLKTMPNDFKDHTTFNISTTKQMESKAFFEANNNMKNEKTLFSTTSDNLYQDSIHNQKNSLQNNLLKKIKYTVQDINNNTIELISKLSEKVILNKLSIRGTKNDKELFNSKGRELLMTKIN